MNIGFSLLELDPLHLEAEILQGDSLQLYSSVAGGVPPFHYLWSPTEGLTDPSTLNTWASPDSTTKYHLIVTDSVGCSISDSFNVIVLTTGIGNPLVHKIGSRIIPNPMTDNAVLEIESLSKVDREVTFYNSLGQSIYNIQTFQTEIPLNGAQFQDGLYMYTVRERDRIITSGKFVVK